MVEFEKLRDWEILSRQQNPNYLVAWVLGVVRQAFFQQASQMWTLKKWLDWGAYLFTGSRSLSSGRSGLSGIFFSKLWKFLWKGRLLFLGHLQWNRTFWWDCHDPRSDQSLCMTQSFVWSNSCRSRFIVLPLQRTCFTDLRACEGSVPEASLISRTRKARPLIALRIKRTASDLSSVCDRWILCLQHCDRTSHGDHMVFLMRRRILVSAWLQVAKTHLLTVGQILSCQQVEAE